MAKYRARPCPNCNYYLGFSIVKPPLNNTEASVASFCLNCSYKLPMRAIVRGIHRTASPLRRGALRLANPGKRRGAKNAFQPRVRAEPTETFINPNEYPRHLRAVGQDLENLRLRTFNLECMENSYVVWAPSKAANHEANPLSRLSKNRLQKLWKNKTEPRPQGQEEYLSVSSSFPTKRYRYSLREIDRIELEGQSRRCQKSPITDGHSLSQLLRTVGGLVAQRGQRLLGISWQELSVSVVVQTVQGRREMDVFRPDNLYDLWVRMYLRRGNRALSDTLR
jgi:hypothetical protein